MAYIREKIRNYIANPNYMPPMRSKSLCKRLEIDYFTANKLINMLSTHEKETILSVFDELDNYNRKNDVDKNMAYKVNTIIIPKLKRYLNNGIQKNKPKFSADTSIDSILTNYIKTPNNDDKLNILQLIIMMSISNGESYSTTAIAKFLGMDESLVRDIIKNYLLNIEEKFQLALNSQIKTLENKESVLVRKISNKKEEN